MSNSSADAVEMYLRDHRNEASARVAASRLRSVARSAGFESEYEFPWTGLRTNAEILAAVERAGSSWSAETRASVASQIRGVLRKARSLGLISGEEYSEIEEAMWQSRPRRGKGRSVRVARH